MKKLSIIFAYALTSITINAKMVEFVEDWSAIKAPQEIADLAEEAAQIVDFDKPYELAAPTKAGMQVAPASKFITASAHPITHNWLIMANPEWFLNLPHDQQIFLLSWRFMIGKMGAWPSMYTYFIWLLMIISWAMMYLVYRLISKTRLNQLPRIVRVFMAIGIVAAFNYTTGSKLQTKFLDYLIVKHEKQVIRATVEKTGNKEAAIQALQTYDAEIKKSIKDGEKTFEPFEHRFEELAQSLTE